MMGKGVDCGSQEERQTQRDVGQSGVGRRADARVEKVVAFFQGCQLTVGEALATTKTGDLAPDNRRRLRYVSHVLPRGSVYLASADTVGRPCAERCAVSDGVDPRRDP